MSECPICESILVKNYKTKQEECSDYDCLYGKLGDYNNESL